MKMVVALIKPFKLDDVRRALADIGCTGMTICEAKGFGRQKGHTELYRGAEYTIDFLPKIRVEIAISDELEQRVTEAIVEHAHTGNIGDGKVFVWDLTHCTRIRTGETNQQAL